ncbi:hypothetical protein L2Y90_13025 [Burkholderia pyrrocinia]|uniref:hypothetical protein n=1 Tax=Burkholderia pyrrocinia TaxID=60550 RepID=UPI00215A95BF|nr:hypothetical protein [Burkholderia pyrrocinia]UVE64771.1 hypothetical protein L2Y90_13025 [Burkholderia pyrrocinia]
MTSHLKSVTPADEQNFLNRTFERVGERGLTVGGACRTLNDAYRSVSGISAITKILIANSVAEDSDENPLNGVLVGGLLDAVDALSSFMIDEIGRLAEHAERGANEREVHHV